MVLLLCLNRLQLLPVPFERGHLASPCSLSKTHSVHCEQQTHLQPAGLPAGQVLLSVQQNWKCVAFFFSVNDTFRLVTRRTAKSPGFVSKLSCCILPPEDTIILMRSTYLQSHAPAFFRERQTESLCRRGRQQSHAAHLSERNRGHASNWSCS